MPHKWNPYTCLGTNIVWVEIPDIGVRLLPTRNSAQINIDGIVTK